ncbi:hypothetical protein KP509_31G031700 [Ceratopteris richardii]|uniref:Uncharacterized protein n=1 Tax=Ceratopteris richardii TaxID=49495 RepID=A0A8T2QZ07_CERRI|nr:hypothetical protein KP509_31G031700 [Ceratopteris richardii]
MAIVCNTSAAAVGLRAISRVDDLSMEQSPQKQQAQSQANEQLPVPTTTPPPAPASGTPPLPPNSNAGGETRRISCEDIQLVQNLIERCLQLYMNRTEVISTLLNQANIEPGFTGLVWQKLEEQNPDFFKAYYARLKLKRQIMLFNQFLEQHAHLTQKMRTIKAPLPALQNGMHPPVHHMPIGYPVPQKIPMVPGSHPHMVPMATAAPIIEGAPISEGFVGSPASNNMSSEMPLLPTSSGIPLNGDIGGSPNTSGGSGFPFSGMGNPTDMSGMGMDVPANFAPDPPFHATENHSHNGIGGLQITADADTGGGRESIGFLSHLPRNFSLSDLTADLSSTTDMLGGYIGSPFLTSEAEGFMRTSDDEKMLDQITDASGYVEFEDEKERFAE